MTLNRAVTNLLLMFVAATGAVLVGRAVAPPRSAPEAEAVARDAAPLPDGIRVTYLHGNYRCATCRTIEATAREAVASGFAEQLRSGQVQWQVVNYESPGNERYTQDYEIVAPCVVLMRFAGGKQTAWKSLPRVWELFDDKAALVEYVQASLREFMGPAAAVASK